MDRDFGVLRWVTFAALLAVSVAYLLPIAQVNRTDLTAVTVLVVLAAALLTWAIESWIRLLISRAVPPVPAGPIGPEARTMLDFSRELLTAQNGQEVLQSVMRFGSAISGAAGCSFVPYDSWGKSLPALVFGHISSDVMQVWVETLSTPAARQACKSCQSLGSDGDCLMRDIAQAGAVRCLTITRNGRPVGMLNFYFKVSTQLGENQQILLREMVALTDAALQNAGWRDQSLSALQQIRAADPRSADLQSLLQELATTLRLALDVDFGLVWISPAHSGMASQPVLHVSVRGGDTSSISLPDQSFIEGIWQNMMGSRSVIVLENVSFQPGEVWRSLLAAPLVWDEGDVVGVMLFCSKDALEFGERQRLVVQTLAGETALLVQNSNQIARAEFQAVVNERARLAREIHDGLAQTLAFLKMQSSQMQTYLEQGDLSRLTDALKNSGRTLTDAYLDARQAIEQLRRVPSSDLTAWLCQTALDFEAATGLRVDTSHLNLDRDVPLMTQAQLVRIVQEALSNVRKHAQAKNVAIYGRMQDDALILEVMDDGCGFTPESIAPSDRFGLRGMRERAEALGADFQIISRPGNGAVVRVRLPMERVA
ncbi:MAG: GAF domain-containing sensor histidine kinase [Anaerolineales bacterium]